MPARFTWQVLILECGDPWVAEVGSLWNPATSANGWFGSPDNCTIDGDGRLGSRPIRAKHGTRPASRMACMQLIRKVKPAEQLAMYSFGVLLVPLSRRWSTCTVSSGCELRLPTPGAVAFEVAGDPGGVLLAPMLLPLVENAFKHGDLGAAPARRYGWSWLRRPTG